MTVPYLLVPCAADVWRERSRLRHSWYCIGPL